MHSASAELIEHASIGWQSTSTKMDEASRIQQFDQAANDVSNAPAPRAQAKKIALHHHGDHHHQRKTQKLSISLDESFDYFYNHEGFGPNIDSTPVPESIVEAYCGKLPDSLLTYWKAMGWAGFGNGLLWLVDPREYADVLNAWLHATDFYSRDRYHVFARGAFGDLYVWGERTGPSLHINSPNSMIFPSDKSAAMARGQADLLLRTWFVVCDKDAFDKDNGDDKPLFERAVKLLGRPGPDEMFGFVPALALGGPRRLDRLQKVNAIEHLMLLAQVHPPRVMLDIVKEAKTRGLM